MGMRKFSEESFKRMFTTFDKDKSGTIERWEMSMFLRTLMGGDKEANFDK